MGNWMILVSINGPYPDVFFSYLLMEAVQTSFRPLDCMERISLV